LCELLLFTDESRFTFNGKLLVKDSCR
jgi:hypothetical protein